MTSFSAMTSYSPNNLTCPILSPTVNTALSPVLNFKLDDRVTQERFSFLGRIQAASILCPRINAHLVQLMRDFQYGRLTQEECKKILLKQEGYVSRLFSAETWEEWHEHRTPIGRIVQNLVNLEQVITACPTMSDSKIQMLTKHYSDIDVETLHKANEAAARFLSSKIVARQHTVSVRGRDITFTLEPTTGFFVTEQSDIKSDEVSYGQFSAYPNKPPKKGLWLSRGVRLVSTKVISDDESQSVMGISQSQRGDFAVDAEDNPYLFKGVSESNIPNGKDMRSGIFTSPNKLLGVHIIAKHGTPPKTMIGEFTFAQKQPNEISSFTGIVLDSEGEVSLAQSTTQQSPSECYQKAKQGLSAFKVGRQVSKRAGAVAARICYHCNFTDVLSEIRLDVEEILRDITQSRK